jgi:hypothetical protein
MRQTRPNNWMERQITWTDTDAEEREAELAEALEKQTAEEAETASGSSLLLDSLTIGGTESLGASGRFGHRGLVDVQSCRVQYELLGGEPPSSTPVADHPSLGLGSSSSFCELGLSNFGSLVGLLY